MIKKTEYEKAFLEIKKVIKEEFLNFYLVYRKIKKAYLGGFSKKEFIKVLQLCKKYKLNCVYKKFTYKKKVGYACIISHEDIPKNIFKLKKKNILQHSV